MPAARYETVTDAGPGVPWLAMVHGVSQDRRLFSRQVEAFKADYRLLLIDLPGHGLSSDLPGPYGVEEYASSIQSTLKAAGVERSHFLGTHLGATAGLLLACRQPGTFASLVLEAPLYPGRPLRAVSGMLADVAATARDVGMEAAREKWWRDGPWFAVMRERPEACRAAEQRAMIDDFGGRPWLDAGLTSRAISPIDDLLPRLEAPVLILNGEHDIADFVDVAIELHSRLPNCQRAVIEDGGGFPLWEFPDRVNGEIRRFLDAT